MGPVGKVRDPWAVALLSIVTIGVYYVFWTYFVFTELKEHSGEGIGGAIGVVFAILVWPVNLFLLPSEIGLMYQRAGEDRPVTGVTGFWILIPIVGFFIWVWKVQTAMNERW